MIKDCSNLCKFSREHCEWCSKNYIVSKEEYKAKRDSHNEYVYGYLVKYANGKIAGILNKAVNYYELAWIDEETIEKYQKEE